MPQNASALEHLNRVDIDDPGNVIRGLQGGGCPTYELTKLLTVWALNLQVPAEAVAQSRDRRRGRAEHANHRQWLLSNFRLEATRDVGGPVGCRLFIDAAHNHANNAPKRRIEQRFSDG